MDKTGDHRLHILETDPNRFGDLFNRLVRDLFHTLGFDPVRCDVARTGREIDLLGEHRLELKRHLRAECKAGKTPSGGDDLNKFNGAVNAEIRDLKRRDPEAIVSAYFVSLSGFKGSAREQEKARDDGTVLLDGAGVVEELIRGRIIVSRDKAVDAASRCVTAGISLADAALLLHERGLFWLISYHRNHEPAGVVLVHADGTPVGDNTARPVLEAAIASGVLASDPRYFAPSADGPSPGVTARAREAYFGYLEASCGEIQLDGLPAEEQVGSKKLRLENLFVPLHAVAAREEGEVSADGSPDTGTGGSPAEEQEEDSEEEQEEDHERPASARQAVGHVLARCARIALLGPPGCGKTTLIKRLAVAYAFPARRAAVDDRLPDREWLPLFLRCRELGTLVRRPLLDVLLGAGERASLEQQLRPAFEWLVTEALRSGQVLVLVDGLDEISDTGDRAAFVDELRTFLARYPSVALVVTSREAGFRAVSGALGAECERLRVAEFSDDEIRSLIAAWHREVYGASREGDRAAAELAETVLRNDRIRLLIGNPLLLLTLLLVKRWVGELPGKRTVLYEKAIEVLLWTWNVQGHTALPLEEVLPRLEFIAFSMMRDGAQRITLPTLRKLLEQAREELPEVLAFSQVREDEFVERVELRSSLLIQSGHAVEDGRLVPTYEFRHLTFQEYLTARAIAEGHHPGHAANEPPERILEQFTHDEAWREVIPLAAVLVGRRAGGIVQMLIPAAQQEAKEKFPFESAPRNVLAQCLADDVQILPELLERALHAFVSGLGKRWDRPLEVRARTIARGRFGPTFERLAFSEAESRLEPNWGNAFCNIMVVRLGWSEQDLLKGSGDLAPLAAWLASTETPKRLGALLIVMSEAFSNGHDAGMMLPLGDLVASLVSAKEEAVGWAACWALAWLGRNAGWGPERQPEVVPRLMAAAATASNPEFVEKALWALSAMPPVSRETLGTLAPPPGLAERLVERQESTTAHACAYYARVPWSDQELAQRIVEHGRGFERRDEFLRLLGVPLPSRPAKRRRPGPPVT